MQNNRQTTCNIAAVQMTNNMQLPVCYREINTQVVVNISLLFVSIALEGITLCGMNSSDTHDENLCSNDSLNHCDSFFGF